MYKLPPCLVELIMSCITSTSVSVLFNGGKLEPFQPTRGIRQGDPLSPYIFIMCMEFLGFLINGKCEEHLWDPVKAARNGPRFSHSVFADDLVLFAKVDAKNCSNVKEVLETFCDLSSQKVNQAKSKVYFSPNVEPEVRGDLCNILGFNFTPNLGNILVFPLTNMALLLMISISLLREFKVSCLVGKPILFLWQAGLFFLNQ
jgi:hypothetical protein